MVLPKLTLYIRVITGIVEAMRGCWRLVGLARKQNGSEGRHCTLSRCSHLTMAGPWCDCVRTNQQKSVLPPLAFSPRAMTSPGGIDGLGVSNHTRASGKGASQCAAFNRAVGKMTEVFLAPNVRARSTKA